MTRVYLDFDGVVHAITDEFHKLMNELYTMGAKFYDKYPQYSKLIQSGNDTLHMFWMEHYFEKANLIASCLLPDTELYVHSNWRGSPQAVYMALASTDLLKFYRGCLDPREYPLDDFRLTNVLKHMKNTQYKDKWVAIDDYDDLFYFFPEHFVKCDSRKGFLESQCDELKEKLK